jgi:alanine racemase
LEELKLAKKIQVTGVMSHLHSGDKIENNGIEKQIEIFKRMYYEIINYGHTPTRRHIGNTAGIIKINNDFFNAYRP